MLPWLGLTLNWNVEETPLIWLFELLSESQEPDKMQTRAKPGRDFPVAMAPVPWRWRCVEIAEILTPAASDISSPWLIQTHTEAYQTVQISPVNNLNNGGNRGFCFCLPSPGSNTAEETGKESGHFPSTYGWCFYRKSFCRIMPPLPVPVKRFLVSTRTISQSGSARTEIRA